MKFKDYLDFIFTFSSYILRPHYKRSHFKQKRTFNDLVNHYIYYLGTWIVLILAYCLMVYLFGIDYEVSIGERFSRLFEKPPIETIDEVYSAIKGSLLVNLFFIYVFYKAISSNAERSFMRHHFIHHKLSGLIKVIKMGEFSEESRFAELTDSEVSKVRRNLKALVSPSENELLVFVTASGWDFFGNSPSQASEEEGSEEEVGFWKSLLLKIVDLIGPEDLGSLNNGYMLEIISRRYKRVEIILLNPKSEAAQKRASSYTVDDGHSHNVLENVDEYKSGIEQVLKNLAQAKKKNPHIAVRIIDKVPSWKIVKVDKEVWVQPIIEGTRSDHTTLYGYRNEPSSMYHTFFNKVEYLWAEAVEVNLDNYLE